jgi:hypothetical protein
MDGVLLVKVCGVHRLLLGVVNHRFGLTLGLFADCAIIAHNDFTNYNFMI